MHKLLILITFVFVTHAVASPEEAERIKRTYELSLESWVLKMKIAKTDAEKQVLMVKRPSPEQTATELWAVISRSLKMDWSIPYSAFYLNLTHHVPVTDATTAKQRKIIMDGFENVYFAKPNIGSLCIALTQSGSPRALPILEKVISKNPDKKCQGIAALGASLLLKNLGDSPEIIEKRLTHLRMAIIQAADEKIGELDVAKLASDELFIINHLVKGRTPPEFSGSDVSGRIIKSADFKGKITVILFWDAQFADMNKVIEITNRLVDKYVGKPVSIIGITPESLTSVRKLQADEITKWNNIIDSKDEIYALYRIKSRPAIFIINAAGKLEYSGLPGSFVELTVDALLEGKVKGK
jgi:peroxiredoxin